MPRLFFKGHRTLCTQLSSENPMSVLDDDAEESIVSRITRLYDFFSLWNIITPETYQSPAKRTFIITNVQSTAWVGINIITQDPTRTVLTYIGIKRNRRQLTLDGNTRDGRYVLELPGMAHEEDQDVKMMMGFILEALYDYPTERGSPLITEEVHIC